LAIGAAVNIVLAAALVYWIRRRAEAPLFAATLRQIRRTPHTDISLPL